MPPHRPPPSLLGTGSFGSGLRLLCIHWWVVVSWWPPHRPPAFLLVRPSFGSGLACVSPECYFALFTPPAWPPFFLQNRYRIDLVLSLSGRGLPAFVGQVGIRSFYALFCTFIPCASRHLPTQKFRMQCLPRFFFWLSSFRMCAASRRRTVSPRFWVVGEFLKSWGGEFCPPSSGNIAFPSPDFVVKFHSPASLCLSNSLILPPPWFRRLPPSPLGRV